MKSADILQSDLCLGTSGSVRAPRAGVGDSADHILPTCGRPFGEDYRPKADRRGRQSEHARARVLPVINHIAPARIFL